MATASLGLVGQATLLKHMKQLKPVMFNTLSWLNDEPCIACPDLIRMIDQLICEPVIIGSK